MKVKNTNKINKVYKILDKYNLPDHNIINTAKKFESMVWLPDNLFIILGRSDSFETSVVENEAIKHQAIIVKRPSGGHSVVLSPKTAVVSMLFTNDEISTKKIFKLANSIIIKSLTDLGVENLSEKGISDICISDKKILGSSIYKKANKVLYHAVINHSENTNLIQKLLKHPKKEPEYRQGRSHKEFVTSIQNQGYNFTILELINSIKNNLFEE